MLLPGSPINSAPVVSMPSIGLFAHPSQDMAVNPDNVLRVLRGCERELGLSRQYGLPVIDIHRRVLLEHLGCGAAYDPETKSLRTPRQQDEALIFHELGHYLMHQEGLLLQNDPFIVGWFYQKLVNETLAEAATFNVFGYEEQAFSYPRSALVDQQRTLTEGYIQGIAQKKWDSRILTLENLLQEARCFDSDIDIGVRLVAVENSLRLHEKKVTSPQLVEQVRAAKARYSLPTEIYYYGVVEALR